MNIYQETEYFEHHMRQLGWEKVKHCKECKHWDTEDGTFPDIDGNEWHQCEIWRDKTNFSDDCVTPQWHYCGWSGRKDTE